MVLDAESVIERRRLKRRVTIWRIAAVVLGLLFLGAFFFGDRQMAGSAGILPHIARINVSGVITDDRKPSAHFEHTVLITHGEPEILTLRPREALPEMLGLPAW